jgi:hypothetical protein
VLRVGLAFLQSSQLAWEGRPRRKDPGKPACSKQVLELGSKREPVLELGSKRERVLELGSRRERVLELGSRQVLELGSRQVLELGSRQVLELGSIGRDEGVGSKGCSKGLAGKVLGNKRLLVFSYSI